ncbi:hypothetical protein GQ457_01G026330 [Hibiscus cannabinus]
METYASKVMGHNNRGGIGSEPKGFLEDEVTIMKEDIIFCRGLSIPSICFSNRVHDQIDHNMRNALIVHLLGRSIGYNNLFNRIQALCKPIGNIQLIDLDNSYFIISFSNESDYTRVLIDGPRPSMAAI